jgi:hypothetical protein
MDMYHANHPNGDYQVANKVQVLDPPRAIGRLTGQEKDNGHLEFGGWTWRHDLAPLGRSETAVTLTYDWSAVPQFTREYIQFPPFGPEHLTNSLHHLVELAAPTSRAWTLGR